MPMTYTHYEVEGESERYQHKRLAVRRAVRRCTRDRSVTVYAVQRRPWESQDAREVLTVAKWDPKRWEVVLTPPQPY